MLEYLIQRDVTDNRQIYVALCARVLPGERSINKRKDDTPTQGRESFYHPGENTLRFCEQASQFSKNGVLPVGAEVDVFAVSASQQQLMSRKSAEFAAHQAGACLQCFGDFAEVELALRLAIE